MSPLWEVRAIKQLKTIHERPSPKRNNHILNFAQSLISVLDRFFPKFYKCSNSIKGISLFISAGLKVKGGMTVEASMVLPLFVFFFINLSSSMEMIRLHGNLELALWEVGNRMTVYGSVLERKESEDKSDVKMQEVTKETEDSLWKELAGVALSYTYIKDQLITYLGEDYLENAPLTYGTDGLQFLESDVLERKDCFEVVLTYQVSPVGGLAAFLPFRMANKYYGHWWNGYEIPKDEVFVYMTENGEVYHVSKDCTHLRLSVQEMNWQQVGSCRNAQGKKYVSCEKCCEEAAPEKVYITNEGECYHYKNNCPGLKRTIMCIWLSEVESAKLCQRCAQK